MKWQNKQKWPSSDCKVTKQNITNYSLAWSEPNSQSELKVNWTLTNECAPGWPTGIALLASFQTTCSLNPPPSQFNYQQPKQPPPQNEFPASWNPCYPCKIVQTHRTVLDLVPNPTTLRHYFPLWVSWAEPRLEPSRALTGTALPTITPSYSAGGCYLLPGSRLPARQQIVQQSNLLPANRQQISTSE